MTLGMKYVKKNIIIYFKTRIIDFTSQWCGNRAGWRQNVQCFTPN